MGTIKEFFQKSKTTNTALQKWIKGLSLGWLTICFIAVYSAFFTVVVRLFGEGSVWERAPEIPVTFLIFSLSTPLWVCEAIWEFILGFFFGRKKCFGPYSTAILSAAVIVMLCFRTSRVLLQYTLLLMLPWLAGLAAALLWELVAGHRERLANAFRQIAKALKRAAVWVSGTVRPFWQKNALICMGVLALWQCVVAFSPHALTVLFPIHSNGIVNRFIEANTYVAYQLEQAPALLWPAALAFGVWFGHIGKREAKFAVGYSLAAACLFGLSLAVFILHRATEFGYYNAKFFVCAWVGQTISWIVGMLATFRRNKERTIDEKA